MNRAETIHHMLAQHHANASAIHAKAMDGEAPGTQAHKYHKAMADEHAQQKDEHLEEMKECAKTDSGGSLEKRLPELDQVEKIVEQAVAKALADTVRPTEVRAVIPNAFGVTMVPRAGQQQQPAKPNVDSSFAKLFSVSDDDRLLQ